MSVAYPQLHLSRCVRYRYRYSRCNRCAAVCPHDAIALSENGPSLDPARCQHCALCVGACRTGAWESEALQPVELLRRAIGQERFSFACAPSGRTADAVVPCLGAIDAATLAYLARRPIAVKLHGTGHCGACPHAPRGVERLEAHIDACRALAGASGADAGWVQPVVAGEDGTCRQTRTGPDRAASRRQLFRRLLGRAVDEVVHGERPPDARPVAPDKAIRAGAYALPEQRELLQLVCRRADEEAFDVAPHEALPLMGLVLGPGCTACEACFRACPTGALRIDESPDDWRLGFDADRCVACGVCVEVCQPRALAAAPVLDARPEGPPRMLKVRAKRRCARCGRHFVAVGAEETCPICRDDEDAFAEIFG